MVKRLSSTEETEKLVNELVKIHGPVVFHQSGGCCDGSAPMCFPRSEFRVGSRDIFLGSIQAQPFFIAEDQYYELKPETVKNVIDTTGAGDAFAAGFLYGLLRGRPLDICGQLGGVIAGEVISNYGARAKKDLNVLVQGSLKV